MNPQASKSRNLMGEYFDYPGGYPERADGETLGAIHLDELGVHYETVETTGPTRALGVGQTFRVTDVPRPDQNREYLVVRAHYELHNHDLGSGATDDTEMFQGAFTLMDSTRQFRPARHTPRPIVQGPQTAVVVGDKKTQPDATEIVTDEHARVRIRFFWERLGGERSDEPDDEEKRNEDMTTLGPRLAGVGGLAVGRDSHSAHRARGDRRLPGGQSRSTDRHRPGLQRATTCRPTRCRRTRPRAASRAAAPRAAGPSNFNEIRFEDKKGGEELHVQAERDHFDAGQAQSVAERGRRPQRQRRR